MSKSCVESTPRVADLESTFDYPEPMNADEARNWQADRYIAMRHLAIELERSLSQPEPARAGQLPTLLDVKAAIDAGDIERARALFNAGIQFVSAGQVAEPEWLREARNGHGPSFFVAYIDALLAAHSSLERRLQEAERMRDHQERFKFAANERAEAAESALASLADTVASALRNTGMFGIAESIGLDSDLREFVWRLSYRANEYRSAQEAAEERERAAREETEQWKKLYVCAQNANTYRQDALDGRDSPSNT